MPVNSDGSIDWDQINNAVGDGIADSGQTVTDTTGDTNFHTDYESGTTSTWTDSDPDDVTTYDSGGNTPTNGDAPAEDQTTTDLSSDGNPTEDQLKDFHDTWGDTTTSFEDAAGPSYEEQLASEIVRFGGVTRENLESTLELPSTTLEGVKAEFEKMVSGSETSDVPTNETATPSIPSMPSIESILPENWPPTDSDRGLLVAGVGLVVFAVASLGGRS